MGEAMAGHLLDAGHELTVHNRTREREEALAARGARRAGDAARGRAGRRARVPLRRRIRPTSRPSCWAPAASPRASRAGAVVLDCSTIAPDTSRRVAAALAERGAGAVDAPVSGGSEGARKGQLTAFVGGEDAHVAIARPALEAFCRSITHLGGPGAGQAGKAVNQVLISGTYAALGEGLALGEREGLPLEALVEALGGGAAGSWILQNRSGNVIRGSYPLGFRMELHLKDLRIALAEADRLGLPMEVTRLVAEQAQRLVDCGPRRRGLLVARARRARRDRLVIERYLQIRAATVAGHLPSGELGYLADVTGLLQLWRVAPDGLHEQVTFGSERVTAALASPSEERWVIARDAGGNERHALFAIDADGGSELALSDDPDAIHVPGAFSPDGRELAFTHTGRNGVDFDVAVVAVYGGGRRELAQPGGWSHVVDWSEHGILVQRANTPFDHDLFLVDPESGDAHAAHPARRRGRLRLGAAAARRLRALRLRRRAASSPAWRVLRQGAEPRAPDARRRRRRDRRARRDAHAPRLDDQPRRRERGVARRRAPRGPAGRRRLGARLRARRLADASRPARPTTRPTSGRPRPPCAAARARPSAASTARDSCGRCSSEVESFDGRRIPYLRFGAAGRPGAVLGARRPGVAVPAADGAGDPVPVRAGHHRRGAQRARLDRLRPHLSPPRRRRAAARLGRRPRGARPRARRRVRHARRRDGRLLRRLHDDGRDHRASRSSGRAP